jgi:DNA-binding beta-propeller fold protein YncE
VGQSRWPQAGGEPKIRGWNGGIALARDIGTQGNPDHVAYTVFVDNPSRDFGRGNPGALDVYIVTKTGVEELAKVKGGIQVHDAFRELAGLAAYNGLLLLSAPAANELFAFDVRGSAKAPFATFPVDNLGGIAFEPDGKLLVATGGAIKRFTIANDWKTFRLTDGDEVVAASDLQAPRQTIEQDKEIYVTDWGTSHQVKVVDATSGKLVRTIGKSGGPQVGDYDEQRMAHPLGMCVDSKPRGPSR